MESQFSESLDDSCLLKGIQVRCKYLFLPVEEKELIALLNVTKENI